MKRYLLNLSIALLTGNLVTAQCGFDNHAVTTSTNTVVCKGEVEIGLATSTPWDGYTIVVNGDTTQWQNGDPDGGSITFDPFLIQESTTVEVVAQNWINPTALYYSPWGLNYAQNTANGIGNVFTMQAWVNTDNHAPGQYYPIASYQGNTPSFGLINGEPVLYIGALPVLQAFGQAIPEMEWHHVAATYNGNTGEAVIFINGNQVASSTTSPQTISTNVLRIGADFNASMNIFQGSIDNLAVFDVVLNQTQITEYKETCLDATIPNLTALYLKNEGTGNFILDEVTGILASFSGPDFTWVWVGGYWQVCSYPCWQAMSSPITINVTDVPTEDFAAVNTAFCEEGENTNIQAPLSHNGASYFLIDSQTGDTITGPVVGDGGSISLNTGALNETTTFHVEGAMVYPASGIRLVNAGLFPDIDYSYTDFTIETWFKNDITFNYTFNPDILLSFNFDQDLDIPVNAAIIRADASTGQPIIVGHNFFSPLPQPAPSSNGATNIMDGEWYHLALSFSEADGNYRLYVNGVEEITYATPFTNYPWMGGLVVVDVENLENDGEPTPSARGTYDEIRFWSLARTSSELMSTMNGCIDASAPNLDGYWRVDEMQGGMLIDIAGNLGNLFIGGDDEGIDFIWTSGVNECALCGAVVSDPITIEVGDTDLPTVTCENYTAELDASGQATILVSDLNVVATDNCDPSPLVSLSQSTFTCADATDPVMVTVTATDASGNEGTCQSEITVVDNINPIITNVPAEISVVPNNAGCSAIVTWDLPDFEDNCGVVTINASHNPGDEFDLGLTVVAYTIFDAEGNSANASFNVIVTNDLAVNITKTDVTCFGDETGEIEATASAGQAPYTYSWDNGASTATISDLAAGSYVLIVTDANGCESVSTATIHQPAELEISDIVVTNPSSCGTNTGSVTLNVVGGTAAYDYEWSNNTSSQNLEDVGAGIYELLVTDANGCTVEQSWTLEDPDAPIVTLDADNSVLSLACNGDENGVIEINVVLQGGATTATYNWNNGEFTSQNIEDLSAGSYALVVQDENNCTTLFNAAVTAPDALVITDVVTTNLACNNDDSGSIEITVTGGTPSYTFDWNDGDFATQNLEDLAAGTYELVITDENNCSIEATYELTEPSAITISESVTDIIAGNDGAVDITVAGGTGAYSYEWSGPSGFESTDMNLSGLNTAGEYTVTVTDENDCEVELTVTVESFVNIAEHTNNGFNLYPNPSNGAFFITTPFAEGKIVVTDALGRVIATKSINGLETQIDLTGQGTGVYLFEVHQGVGKTILRGVMK
jgi:uncharacterized protein (DUF2141 family)